MPYKDETIYHFSHDGIARLREKIPQALRGEDDFFHEPEGLGLACTRRTRITFACGYGDSATVCFLFSLYVSMRLQLFYEAFSKRNVTFAKEIKCNSQDFFWHFLYYRTKKVSDAICEDTQLFSLSQPGEPITCSSGCIFPASCNWYLLATSIPSRKVCMGVFPKQYFPECVLCVL